MVEWLKDLIVIIGLTLAPFLELRASIPYALLQGKYLWWAVFLVAVSINIILAPIAYLFWNKLIHLLRWIKPVDRLYHKTIERVQKKSSKYVEKYGELGVALFIGIPFPGTGVWSGALAANIFAMKFSKYMIASVIGVLMSGALVTLMVVSGVEVFKFLL